MYLIYFVIVIGIKSDNSLELFELNLSHISPFLLENTLFRTALSSKKVMLTLFPASVVVQCWEDREGRKKMNKSHAKSLTTLRQKLKKYSRDFESDMENYRKSPDEGDIDDEPEADGGCLSYLAFRWCIT